MMMGLPIIVYWKDKIVLLRHALVHSSSTWEGLIHLSLQFLSPRYADAAATFFDNAPADPTQDFSVQM